MSAQVVILLAIGEAGSDAPALRCSQTPMMEEGLLPKGARRPAHHARCGYSHPVDPAGLVGTISANFLKAFAPKYLALPGDMIAAFKAVRAGVISSLFLECRTGNTQTRILPDFIEQKLEMIRIERDVRIQIADHVILQILHALQAGIERVHLGGKMPFLPDGQV